VLPLSEQISNPFFSPDGSRLAFGAYLTGKRRLTIANFDGSAARTLSGAGCRSCCEFAPRVVGWA
jgi:Tol biopolymer transport system component